MYRARSLLIFVAVLCFSSFSSLAAANPWDLTPGTSASNTIVGDDFHHYRIRLTQAGTLTLYTSGNSDTIGWLYDVTNGVTAGVFVASDDDGGEGYNFRVSSALAAGNYLLEVSTYDGEGGSYTLHSAFTASGSSGSGGSSGGSMTTPWQQSGVLFNRTPTGASTSARFGIGLTHDGGNSYVTTASTADNLQVLGFIQPEPQHVGRLADIFVVDRVNMNFMMRNVDGNYSNWSSNVADLVPAMENVPLQSLTTVTVHSGRIGVSGDHRLFLGYMVDGQLYYTLTPLQLNITVSNSGGGTGTGSSGRPKLTTATSGSGQGSVSPSAGEYNVGEVVTVRADPHRYSYFHSWTSLSGGCPGLTGGCRVTMNGDVYMQARFEPITWAVPIGDFTYQIFLDDGAEQCTWNVTWTNARAEFTWRRQTSGSYQGSVTLTGHRKAESSQRGCNGSDGNINTTTNIDASGDNFAVRFLARSGVGSEYITLSSFGALGESPVPVTGFIEYTGTNRRGRHDFGINSIAPENPF